MRALASGTTSSITDQSRSNTTAAVLGLVLAPTLTGTACADGLVMVMDASGVLTSSEGTGVSRHYGAA